MYEYMQDEEHSLLFFTHITSDLDKIADYVVMLEGGKIILNELKDDLRERYQEKGEALPDIETIMLDVSARRREII